MAANPRVADRAVGHARRRLVPRALALLLTALVTGIALLPPPAWGGEMAAVASRSAAPEDTAARLAQATRPGLEPPALAARLAGTRPGPASGGSAGPSGPLRAPERTAADVGRVERFSVLDQTRKPNVQLEVGAELRLVTPHGHWYVQQGRQVDDAALRASAENYEQTIYPVVQRIVGGGRDIGPVALLHADVPGVAGYFDSRDLWPRWVYGNSNERPTVYLNVSAVRPGTTGYAHTVSHELTHLFHYYVNPFEDTWLKEGLGELAQEIVDPNYQYGVGSFLSRPSTQLTAWAHPPADVSVHYQSAYLFLRYFLERYGGPGILGALLQGAGRGASTVDAFLAASGRPERFEDVFRDWVVASLVQDPSVAAGQYGYQRPPQGRPRVSQVSSTGLEEGRLPQYGTDYWRVAPPAAPGGVRVRFQGAPAVPLLGADPPGGGLFWWSQRGDMVDTRLTRELDLRGVTQATLTFDLRFDIEDDYDYGYVMVSTDNGARWQPVAGQHTTDANPTGRNLGVGYNGKSGGAAQWVREAIDLTPYAGQRLLVRFEYVTDDAYNAEGLAVTNVAVPEMGWQDDGSGWTAEGWARVENALPQRFAVQIIEYRGDQVADVRQMAVAADGRGEATIPGLGADLTSAVLVVSALAPHTLQPSRYSLAVEPLGQ